MADFPYDVVGFDLDGTLLDTARDLGEALNHALALAGRATIPLAEIPGLVGGGTTQLVRGGLLRTGGIDEAEVPALTEQLVAYYAANIARHTALYPGGAAMLAALEARGVQIAVATNKREDLARRVFDELGLSHRLATVIGGDTLGPDRAKPKPDMLIEMVRRTGARRAAFVGDTSYDIGAARAAGLPVVAVSFGFCDKPAHLLGADAVIDHFDELIPALLRLG